MKCPECKAQCWRDEHPDGYAVGLWNCSECPWGQEDMSKHLVSDKDLEKLPF